jgi:glycosyltransferase involved in cell wall biosynthesis
MDILVINHYAGSSRHGMDYRQFYLAREWAKRGHHVTMVAASASHLRIKAPEIKGDLTEEDIEGIRYIWLRTPRYRGNGVDRALNMLVFIGQLLRHKARLVRDYRPDAVIAASTYPLDMLPACQIARNCDAKLIYEVHDLWPLSLIELGGMSPRHPFVMLMQWAEDFSYRNADRVASTLPRADVHMRAHGMAEHKFAYIPNGVSVDEWDGDRAPLPQEHSATLARLRCEGRFLMGYAGTHGLSNGLHTVLDAARCLQEQGVTVVLVGHGPEKEALQQRARRLCLPNVVFLPPIPKRTIPTFLEAMDALFLGMKRMSLYRFGISPTKLIDYMMAGKPVILGNDLGNDLVAETGCGVTVPSEDPLAIASAVTHVMSLGPDGRETMGLRGRDYVLANHDFALLAQRFLQIMQ